MAEAVGRQYRNPDADEPSDAAYGIQRVSALVSLVVLAGLTLSAHTVPLLPRGR